MARRATKRALLAFIAFICSTTLAHPSNTPHPHNASNIDWEADGTKDGNSAHNHRSPVQYLGGSLPGINGYTVSACWDNQDYRIDTSGDFFGKGHCYVDEGNNSPDVPAYVFVGSWPTQAKARVRNAFEAWSEITTDTFGLSTGVEFREVPAPANADIFVRWQNIADPPTEYGGYWEATSSGKDLYFDSSLNWNYQVGYGGLQNNEWHFYSVALHEIGHVVGLNHEVNSSNLMTPSVGLALTVPTPNGLPHRNFSSIDNASINGVQDLYSQTISGTLPPPAATCSIEFIGCSGNVPNYIFTYSPSNSTPVTNYVAQRRVGSGAWIGLGTTTYDSCLPSNAAKSATNTWQVRLNSAYGIGECTITVFINSNVCNTNPW